MIRLYNVIWVRDDKGTRGKLNSLPMTHHEACTYMSKITNHSWRRLILEEV